MNLFEEWLARQGGEIDRSPITLLNVAEPIAQKAAAIDEKYIQLIDPNNFCLTNSWEVAEGAVVNLKILTETPELAHRLSEQQPKLEAIIKAFNLETGKFSEGFNPEIGE